MIINNVELMVTAVEKREKDGKYYYSADVTAISDGKHLKVSVSEEAFALLRPWERSNCSLQILESSYGTRITITDVAAPHQAAKQEGK